MSVIVTYKSDIFHCFLEFSQIVCFVCRPSTKQIKQILTPVSFSASFCTEPPPEGLTGPVTGLQTLQWSGPGSGQEGPACLFTVQVTSGSRHSVGVCSQVLPICVLAQCPFSCWNGRRYIGKSIHLPYFVISFLASWMSDSNSRNFWWDFTLGSATSNVISSQQGWVRVSRFY